MRTGRSNRQRRIFGGRYRGKLEVGDLRQVGADYASQVAIQPGRVANGTLNLLFTLGPQPLHGAFLGVEIFLECHESLDNAFDPLAKLGVGEVAEEQFDLAVLALHGALGASGFKNAGPDATARPSRQARLVTHTPSMKPKVVTSLGISTVMSTAR